jgi:Ran GTPase-activating protein (RanGAP) involved in mRNA processing and transport
MKAKDYNDILELLNKKEEISVFKAWFDSTSPNDLHMSKSWYIINAQMNGSNDTPYGVAICPADKCPHWGYNQKYQKINKELEDNFTILNKVFLQTQAVLSKDTKKIKEEIATLVLKNDKLQADIKNLESEQQAIKNKTAEVIGNKKNKHQEHQKLVSDKVKLIKDLDPKKLSFVLQKAVENSNEGVVKSLINEAFAINFQNKQGQSLLHTAIAYEHKDLIKKLLESAPMLQVNLQDSDGNSPLHYLLTGKDFGNKSVQEKYLPVLKELLSNSVLKEPGDIYIQNKLGISPKKLLEEYLYKAINSGRDARIDQEFIALLTKLPIILQQLDLKEFTHHISNPLYFAASGDNYEVIKILMQSKTPLMESALFECIRADDLLHFRKIHCDFVSDIAKIKHQGINLCYEAINVDANKIIDYFVQNYSTLSYRLMFKEAVFDSVKNNNLKVLKKLESIDKGFLKTKDSYGDDLLSLAINSDASQVIDYLQAKGFSLEQSISGNGVTKINLNNKKLDNDLIISIADLIEDNPDKIKDLNLSKVGLQYQGLKYLSNALEFNSSVKVIDISENALNTDAIDYLCSCLWNNEGIKILNLSKNNFGQGGVSYIASLLSANKSITNLNLSSNYINAVGAKLLAKTFEQNETIDSINLASNNLTFLGAHYISQSFNCTNIRFLDLSDNNLTHNGSIMIANMIKNNQSLLYINLAKNNIGDAGILYVIKALLDNKSLASIDISQNNISQSQTKLFADFIIDTDSISYLNLSKNPLVQNNLDLMLETLKNNEFIALQLPGMEEANNEISNLVKINNTNYEKSLAQLNRRTLELDAYETNKTIKKLFGFLKQIQSKLIDISSLSIDTTKEKSAIQLIDNLLKQHKSQNSNDEEFGKLQEQFDYEFNDI